MGVGERALLPRSTLHGVLRQLWWTIARGQAPPLPPRCTARLVRARVLDWLVGCSSLVRVPKQLLLHVKNSELQSLPTLIIKLQDAK